MDIERQNFLKEVEAETKQQNIRPVKSSEVTNKKIDELFCEATKRFGSTLKNLKD